ncbi:MAG: hypothetical protein M3453_09610 [Pseudomonadota bacterium]|nr:hypothetical protein [Pseudomonadota bacterium]
MAKKQTAKALAKFSVVPGGDGYQLHIEDDSGDTLELSATYEQMELLVDTLDDLLEADDAALDAEAADPDEKR